jgi:signal peptidase I
MGIVENALPVMLLIIIQELVRYVLIDKGKKCIPVVILTIIAFIAADVTIGLRAFPINDGMDIFILIGLLILPAIVNNLLLTYFTYKNGYRGPMMYRFVFSLIAVYMVPFFPNFGPYVDSVLAVVFPVILFLKLNSFFGKDQPITRRTLKMRRFLFWAPTATVLGVVVILTSGLFRFQAMAIASGSMTPNILKGDVVVVERLSNDELYRLEIGDVIALSMNNTTIVHRIIEIEERNNQTIFLTQGDYNESPDNWELNYNHIVGLVRFRIRYIGHPTVWLNERLN